MKKADYIYLMIIEAIFIIILIFADNIRVRDLKAHNRELNDEINELEVELNDKKDFIYDILLDLNKTEKTLAETAQKLDELQTKEEILHLDYVGEFNCTSYCVEKYPHICGTGNGITASGAPVTAGITAAVGDLETFPFGTVLYIEGVGVRIVQDTGGFDMTKIDIAVDTHETALNWSVQGKHKVYIVEVAK